MKTLSQPLMDQPGRPKKHKCEKYADYANGIIFGFGLGSLFFFTSLAGVSKIIPNPAIGIALGSITGIFDAITNGTLAMSATRELLRFRPLLWLLTALAFFTVGLPSGLPFVAASMQSTEEIYNVTGIDIRCLGQTFGNISSALYGTLNSIGIASLVVTMVSLIRAKYFHSKTSQFTQTLRYLHDQRAPSEYQSFCDNPSFEEMLKGKFSLFNALASLLSLAAFAYDYSVSGELPLALNGTDEPIIAKSIGFGGLIPIADYAKTDIGSKVVACLSAGPLHATFVATTLRVLARDIKASACDIREAGLTFLYLIGIVLTAVTPIFEAIEGSGEVSMSIISFFSALFINYSGPRTIYNRIFRKKSPEVVLGSKAIGLLMDKRPKGDRKMQLCCHEKGMGSDTNLAEVP